MSSSVSILTDRRGALDSRRAGSLSPRRLQWIVYALFFVAGVAQSAIVPLLPRLATVYGLSASQTALLLALPGLATLTVSVPAGLAADRLGARRMTLAAAALLTVSCLAQAMPSLAVLMAGRLAFGVSFGVVWTTGLAWLSELETGTKGGRLGPSVTCSSVGVMVGPAVAGVLAQHTVLGLPFMIIAAAGGLVVVGLMMSPGGPDRPSSTPRPRAGGRGVIHNGEPRRRAGGRASIRSLAAPLRRPGVAAGACALVVSGAVSGATQLLITLGLHRGGVSTAATGLVFSAAAVCYLVVSAAVVRLGDRACNLRFNAVATLTLALALVPAVASGGPPMLVLALLASAVPRAAIGTTAYALAAAPGAGGEGQNDAVGAKHTAGDDAEGFVFGMLNGAWAGALVLTPLLTGALEQHGGARAGYLAVILPSLAIACWLITRSRPATLTDPAVAG